jgi:transcription elongation factor Elf1
MPTSNEERFVFAPEVSGWVLTCKHCEQSFVLFAVLKSEDPDDKSRYCDQYFSHASTINGGNNGYFPYCGEKWRRKELR